MTEPAETPSVVDLRSDTVTRPTPAMRRAMAEAEVGDHVLGDDPTAAELERYGAEILGKEAALFFPSGIMANLTALMVLAEPGTEAVIDAGGHMLAYEEGGAAAFAGVQLRAVQTPDGLLTPEAVVEAVPAPSQYVPRTCAVCLENTHNSAGGRVLSAAQTRAVAETARERGARVHLDGARLPNAAAALGVSMAALADPADTVMVALSKGLGAPVGSLLAGSADDMARAWRIRRRLGGGMRQAGIVAAAGLHALRHHLPRLVDDHRRARTLAARLDALPGLRVPTPETNIVMVELEDGAPSPALMVKTLVSRGVWVVPFGPRRLRAVTHADVDDAGIERAAAAFEHVLSRRRTA
jgi:threonine aldolase